MLLKLFLRRLNQVFLIYILDTLARILVGKNVDKMIDARGVVNVHRMIDFVLLEFAAAFVVVVVLLLLSSWLLKEILLKQNDIDKR